MAVDQAEATAAAPLATVEAPAKASRAAATAVVVPPVVQVAAAMAMVEAAEVVAAVLRAARCQSGKLNRPSV